MKEIISSGHCLCSAVNFEAVGPPDRVLNCHCESCRRHTGAPMACLAVFREEQIHWSGDARRTFQSKPGISRGFCGTCGSSLTWELEFRDEGRICAIHISAFEDPNALPPTAHSFYPERLDWFEAFDALPRHAGFVGGTEPISWGPKK